MCLAKWSLLSLRFKQSGGRTTVYASSHRTNFVVNATEEIALHTEHTFQILKDREALRYGCQSVTGNETPQHTRTKPPKSPFCICLQLPHSAPPEATLGAGAKATLSKWPLYLPSFTSPILPVSSSMSLSRSRESSVAGGVVFMEKGGRIFAMSKKESLTSSHVR